MMRHSHLAHRFVQHIPDRLERGVLYISLEYGTAAHSCCCGCGEEVVTPFTPTDWEMTFDGDTVSLNPSIGNWTLTCRSHYIIRRGRVTEAVPWTNEQIDAERQRDRASKARFYEVERSEPVAAADAEPPPKTNPGFMRRVFGWIGKADT